MQQLSLFDPSNEYSPAPAMAPLADRMRPRSLEDYVGQTHLLGEGKLLRQMLEKDQVCSMIFWGPPGVGKTTLAKIIAARTKSDFLNFSAVTSGISSAIHPTHSRFPLSPSCAAPPPGLTPPASFSRIQAWTVRSRRLF